MNKEQFRKELEDVFWIGWNICERYHNGDSTGYENKIPANWIQMDYEERIQWYRDQTITTRLAALDDGKIKTENMSNLKLADFPVLVEMEKGIKMIPFGTVEYWKQRCINREKMDDPTYSDFERSNCQHFHRLLVNKQK